MANIIVWADIPVIDLERASKFYSAITGREVSTMPGETPVALIMGDREEGSIVSADLYVGTPSKDGATVYFGSGGDMDGFIARVEQAGGKILQPKQFMDDMVGWIAFFEDTEGNRIGVQEPGESH